MDDPTSPDRIPLDRPGERPGGDRPPVPRFNPLPDLPELPDLPRGAIPPTPSIPIPAPLPPSLPPGLPAPRVMVDLPRPSPTVSVEPPRPAPPKPQPAAATPAPAPPPAPQGRWVGEALGILFRPTKSKATVLAAAASLVAGAFGLQVVFSQSHRDGQAATTPTTASKPKNDDASPAVAPPLPAEMALETLPMPREHVPALTVFPPLFAIPPDHGSLASTHGRTPPTGEAHSLIAPGGVPTIPNLPVPIPTPPVVPAPRPGLIRDTQLQQAEHQSPGSPNIPTIPDTAPSIPGVTPPAAPVVTPAAPAPIIPTVVAPAVVPTIPATPAAPEPIKPAPVTSEPIKGTSSPGGVELPKTVELPKPIDPKTGEALTPKPLVPAAVKPGEMPSPKPVPTDEMRLPNAIAPPAPTAALNGTNAGGGFVETPPVAPAPAPAALAPVVPTLPPAVPKSGFGGLDAPPVPALAPVPAPAAPKPAGDARTDFDVDLHPAQPGQTYEAISKQHYQDAKYAEALRAFNKNRDPGRDEVQLPPTHVLRKLASGRAPTTPSPIAPAGGETWAPAAATSNPRPAPAGRTYTVPQDGMSFRDIAGELLNDRAKYNRISNLNPNLDANARLKKGDTIAVP